MKLRARIILAIILPALVAYAGSAGRKRSFALPTVCVIGSDAHLRRLESLATGPCFALGPLISGDF